MHTTSWIIVNNTKPCWYYFGEGNADIHLKRTMYTIIIPITDGKLDRGPWESALYPSSQGHA